MSKTYFLINGKVNDFPEYQKYIQATFPLILKHNGMVKVADNNSVLL